MIQCAFLEELWQKKRQELEDLSRFIWIANRLKTKMPFKAKPKHKHSFKVWRNENRNYEAIFELAYEKTPVCCGYRGTKNHP